MLESRADDLPVVQKPWLEYTGQTIGELVAAKDTHRIDSILCAIDEALLQKDEWTPEEKTVRAVMELDAQVHNGGFQQFFSNPSREFAPSIVDCLRQINSNHTAELAAHAIGLLNLAEVTDEAIEAEILRLDEKRDEALNELDQEFYDHYENEQNLFAFIEAHASQILS